MNIFSRFETAFQIIIDNLAADNLLPKDLDVISLKDKTFSCPIFESVFD